jgi:hypothetical protein
MDWRLDVGWSAWSWVRQGSEGALWRYGRAPYEKFHEVNDVVEFCVLGEQEKKQALRQIWESATALPVSQQ